MGLKVSVYIGTSENLRMTVVKNGIFEVKGECLWYER